MSNHPPTTNSNFRTSSRLRRIRNVGLAIISLAVATLLIASWCVASFLIAPVNRAIGEPPEDLPVESISLASGKENQIHGWHIKGNQLDITIILLHPLRSDRRSMLNRARLFHREGYSVMLFDLQAHGESPGDHITFGYREAANVKTIVDYVRDQHPQHQIGIVGRSLGGAATVLSGVDVEAVILESVYGNIESAIHNRIAMRIGPLHHIIAPLFIWQLQPRLGISPLQLRPEDQISGLKCPLMITAGDKDRHTTLSETKELYSLAKEPKQLVIFSGAGHQDLFEFDSQKYQEFVLEFLNKHLSQP